MKTNLEWKSEGWEGKKSRKKEKDGENEGV